ncbi:farnesyl-diphosphate farnesyltransferase [Imleria badia]|nr:farnesyl-diphosphate farnesyltransferase [Imleria badia]
MLGLLLTHPNEFRILLQFYLFHTPKRDITAQQEHPTSGWDRESMRRCWEFLNLTSRSFAAVIKELDGDLARTICMYYLVLRGLDTIEDDMTIPDEIKQPLLRSFHEKTITPGWNFTESGPKEKDRQLLAEYATVVAEVNLLKPEYRNVILDVCNKMEVGMADYAHKAAATGSIYIATVAEYDLYCHYVAGLVGEGLTAIWSASGKEAPWLCEELGLANSMGLLLQKTNIIRDFREDAEERRFFWPREIWGKYGFDELTELYKEANVDRATWIQSEMILDALRHACDSLDYLRLLKNQSVFVFCAIPASMAMATLALCFMNPQMFQRNIKIRKAEAAQLIMRSTNPREVALIFRDYARKIHHKAKPQDPNFLRLSVMCSKIEEWYERNYPSFVILGEGGVTYDPEDKRTAVVKLEEKRAYAKRYPNAAPPSDFFPWELAMYAGGAIGMVILLSAGIVYTILKVYG